jgi:hypothetical protein
MIKSERYQQRSVQLHINQKTSDSLKPFPDHGKKPTGVISVAIGAPLLVHGIFYIFAWDMTKIIETRQQGRYCPEQ